MIEINKIYNEDCYKGIMVLRILGIRPNLIITDPPYEFEAMGGGIHRVGRGVVKYQNIIDAGTNHFDFDKYVPLILDLQGEGVNAYFFCNKTLLPRYLSEAVKRGLNYDVLAIRKLNPIPAKSSSYMPELEYIVFLRSPGAYFNGTLNAKYYKKIYDKNIGKENVHHPNVKPKGLMRQFLMVSSKEDDLILDPFIGSGTTAVACKELNRRFIGFETENKWIDIANKRLKQETLSKETLSIYTEATQKEVDDKIDEEVFT